ncbi:50S ribosomal protein L17 [Candidatus Gottesmanbacteria bacterium]|nr:50S ribosomal protein L17 [Candidatus Gottesmanbacteria bacterium]
MRHKVSGRKLNRTSNERKRLFRNLTRSLILHGSMTTTVAKAKSIQASTEKMITKARNNNIASRRFLYSQLNDNLVVEKLLTEIGPLFKTTNGGYTKIIKLVNRTGDNSRMCVISFAKAVSKSENVKKVPTLQSASLPRRQAGRPEGVGTKK